MKTLTYQIEGYTGIYNPRTEEVEQKLCLAEVIIENPTGADIEKAKENAYKGMYKVDDGGQTQPEPTADEILNALLGVAE